MKRRTADDVNIAERPGYQKPSVSTLWSSDTFLKSKSWVEPVFTPTLQGSSELLEKDLEQHQEGNVDEDSDPLLYRVLTGLDYTRSQEAKGEKIMQTTRLVLKEREHRHPESALEILRQARRDGHAVCIAMSYHEADVIEVWEIGVPRPDWISEGAFGGIHDPQWFYNKSPAQVKAGPYATDADVDKAQAELGKLAKRKARCVATRKAGIEIEYKLAEGLRRQELRLKMYDDAR
ncbi:hypothetical protein OPT61_g1463 [Boeremia exigua]|uniref:Uncharacterized protein n=1 Tax=Boeremia exigua TaxID=749465 RepID=A0ACC2IQ12_9PLEO|nr:hypothetical protein OPT61_g1463 [Boeremia exigua]